jgi:PHD/YefM family antitoxin component YafN of YafNO toxin-antitoxin module
MSWKIANAKQQFSEVVRLCAEQPQAIYNRETCVAVLVSAEQFEAFERWQAAARSVSLTEQFDQVRALLSQAGSDGIDLPARRDRPNALLATVQADDPG